MGGNSKQDLLSESLVQQFKNLSALVVVRQVSAELQTCIRLARVRVFFCLYSIWKYIVESQGVVIRESWKFCVQNHPGHLALWLAAIQCSHPIHPVISLLCQ